MQFKEEKKQNSLFEKKSVLVSFSIIIFSLKMANPFRYWFKN